MGADDSMDDPGVIVVLDGGLVEGVYLDGKPIEDYATVDHDEESGRDYVDYMLDQSWLPAKERARLEEREWE